MRIERFDFELPEELIAQQPADRRDASRLLALPRGEGGPVEHGFADLPSLLEPGDLLVVNDAKVVPARLYARRVSGGLVEILLLHRRADDSWEALVRPGRRVRPGERLLLGEDGAELLVRDNAPGGRRVVELPADMETAEVLDRWGQMPLPPYIERAPGDVREALDRERYQTVYAQSPGAIAAPTAGLHFSDAVLAALEARGIRRASLTLDVGPGTFQPVRVDDVDDHRMEAETYRLPDDCVTAISDTRARGGRVIGVGTTVVRTLEYVAGTHQGELVAGEGEAEIFIYPGYEFQVIDGMLTNFHLPRSTPMLMVAALVGRERLLDAYATAVGSGFRFFSYGDAMLIS